MVIVGDELDYYDIEGHEVVIDDNCEVKDDCVQDINCTIDKGLPPRNTLLRLYSSLDSFVDLPESVLVFANN